MMKERWRRFYAGYARFVEKQGFPIILTVCVAVIAVTAVWTRASQVETVTPTPPVDQAYAAAQLQQQSLRDAATPTPAPQMTAPTFSPPLDTIQVVQAFEGTRLTRCAVTGLWQLHDAADLQADTGTPVKAISDGVVTELADRGVNGAYVKVAHGDVEALYAGMRALTALAVGDPVALGQTLGFVGSGMVDETDLPPHLHLRVTRDGHAFDPLRLWKK